MTSKSSKVSGPVSPLQYALAYAERGWAVFPCHCIESSGRCSCGKAACSSPGKHPLTTNGVHAASSDKKQIHSWWTKRPEANIGIATGETSGFWALDIDGALGRRSLADLEERHGKLPKTAVALTGGGGSHYLFCWNPKKPVKSRVAICPGLDTRGAGGYIIAAPSTHASGKPYEWRNHSNPLGGREIVGTPAWLLNVVTKGKATTPIAKALNKCARQGFQNGTRDTSLFRKACEYRGKKLDIGEARTLILRSAAKCAPPFPKDEALKCLNSAWKYKEEHDCNDLGNARRLVGILGADIHYAAHLKKWMTSDANGLWNVDLTGEVERLAKSVPDLIRANAENQSDLDRRKALMKHALVSGSQRSIDASLRCAQTEPGIMVVPNQIDADPYLFGTAGGVLDLRTQQVVFTDSIVMKRSPVVFDSTATCPQWERFISEVLGQDPALIAYFQRAAGYSLSGKSAEQCFFFLWGTGANGKSTVVEVLSSVFGDYSTVLPAQALLAGLSTDNPAIASLSGARLAIASEMPDGKSFDEPLLKLLTGGDTLNARFLYSNYFNFKPTHTLWIAGNHCPDIKGNDDAVWRRVRLIPFSVTIPPDKQDRCLKEKLLGEAPGILNWLLAGYRQWTKVGLSEPKVVQAAVNDYRDEQDVLGAWLEARCIKGPAEETSIKRLYDDYAKWSAENSEVVMNIRQLGRKLSGIGFAKRKTSGHVLYRGLRLKQRTLHEKK